MKWSKFEVVNLWKKVTVSQGGLISRAAAGVSVCAGEEFIFVSEKASDK